MRTAPENNDFELTGRCYCGAITIKATKKPQTIAYCHCADCRRWTSAPVTAFAAFDEDAVEFTPNDGQTVSINPGVSRTFCPNCGTPLTGRYDYLPGQVYIGVSVFDQGDDLAPKIHTHESARLKWLHIEDDIERVSATGRSELSKK